VRRTWLILLMALLAAGCGRGGDTAQRLRRGDPAIQVAFAIVALERSDEQRLTREQAGKILPLLKVLRDMSAEDRDAAQAVADQIQGLFTPGQQAALRQMREETRERSRRPGGQGAGPPGRGQGGGGPDPGRRAELGRRALDRAIRIVEARAKP